MLFLSATAYTPTPRLPRVPLKLSAFTRTPSGLEFEDIVVGDGRQPSVGDFVGVAYDLSLLDRPLTGEQLEELVDRAQRLAGDETAVRAVRQIVIP